MRPSYAIISFVSFNRVYVLSMLLLGTEVSGCWHYQAGAPVKLQFASMIEQLTVTPTRCLINCEGGGGGGGGDDDDDDDDILKFKNDERNIINDLDLLLKCY